MDNASAGPSQNTSGTCVSLRVVHSKHEGSGHQDHGIFDPGVVRREGPFSI